MVDSDVLWQVFASLPDSIASVLCGRSSRPFSPAVMELDEDGNNGLAKGSQSIPKDPSV